MKGLNLKYHLSKVTSSYAIKDSIIRNLEQRKYKVKSSASNIIVFDGGADRAFERLGEGIIEIIHTDEGSIILIEYYADLIAPLMFFVIVLVGGIVSKYYFFIVFVDLALVINELIRKVVWKRLAKSLLEDILK